MRRAAVVVSSLVLALVGACKQGEGQRCQINDDCASGLICTTQGICGTSNDSTADAGPPPDARDQIDASELDAGDTVDADVSDADLPDAT
jgi:hypothetical protein